MIPWRMRALAADAVNLLAQVTNAAPGRHGGRILPLMTVRNAAPDPAPELVADRGQPGARIAVVLHSHFPDVLPDLLRALDAIPEPFDLLVTTTAADADALGSRAASVRVFRVPNRGRDILPLLRLVNAEFLEGYDLVCKIHTKRSSWRADGGRFEGDGALWRDALVQGVVGSPEHAAAVVGAFDADPALMLVTAPGQVLGPAYWGANLPLVRALGRRGGVRVDPAQLQFPAGSMYWARGAVLRRLRDLDLGSAHFDLERGQDDGTTAHAVERYLGYLAAAMGTVLTSDVVVPGS
jgi:lipopolysaccharide biosynthesis protein